MNKKQRAFKIKQILDHYFPDPEVPLQHRNHFTFLIAVLLSAQCTDERVNLISPKLFDLAETPEKWQNLS